MKRKQSFAYRLCRPSKVIRPDFQPLSRQPEHLCSDVYWCKMFAQISSPGGPGSATYRARNVRQSSEKIYFSSSNLVICVRRALVLVSNCLWHVLLIQNLKKLIKFIENHFYLPRFVPLKLEFLKVYYSLRNRWQITFAMKLRSRESCNLCQIGSCHMKDFCLQSVLP